MVRYDEKFPVNWQDMDMQRAVTITSLLYEESDSPLGPWTEMGAVSKLRYLRISQPNDAPGQVQDLWMEKVQVPRSRPRGYIQTPTPLPDELVHALRHGGMHQLYRDAEKQMCQPGEVPASSSYFAPAECVDELIRDGQEVMRMPLRIAGAAAKDTHDFASKPGEITKTFYGIDVLEREAERMQRTGRILPPGFVEDNNGLVHMMHTGPQPDGWLGGDACLTRGYSTVGATTPDDLDALLTEDQVFRLEDHLDELADTDLVQRVMADTQELQRRALNAEIGTYGPILDEKALSERATLRLQVGQVWKPMDAPMKDAVTDAQKWHPRDTLENAFPYSLYNAGVITYEAAQEIARQRLHRFSAERVVAHLPDGAEYTINAAHMEGDIRVLDNITIHSFSVGVDGDAFAPTIQHAVNDKLREAGATPWKSGRRPLSIRESDTLWLGMRVADISQNTLLDTDDALVFVARMQALQRVTRLNDSELFNLYMGLCHLAHHGVSALAAVSSLYNLLADIPVPLDNRMPTKEGMKEAWEREMLEDMTRPIVPIDMPEQTAGVPGIIYEPDGPTHIQEADDEEAANAARIAAECERYKVDFFQRSYALVATKKESLHDLTPLDWEKVLDYWKQLDRID